MNGYEDTECEKYFTPPEPMTNEQIIQTEVDRVTRQLRSDRDNTNVTSNGVANFINFPTGVDELAGQILLGHGLAIMTPCDRCHGSGVYQGTPRYGTGACTRCGGRGKVVIPLEEQV